MIGDGKSTYHHTHTIGVCEFFEMGSKSSLDINTEKMGGAKFLGES